MTEQGSVERGEELSLLDGTVTVVDSRGVQVGDHLVQKNTIRRTYSPDIDALQAVANDRELANSLVDAIGQPTEANTLRQLERKLAAGFDKQLPVPRASQWAGTSCRRTAIAQPTEGVDLPAPGSPASDCSFGPELRR